MKISTFLFLIALFPLPLLSQKKEKIIYEYKKHEKFDFDDLSVEGDSSTPWDLSIELRKKKKFSNKIIYKKDFNQEIITNVFRVR